MTQLVLTWQWDSSYLDPRCPMMKTIMGWFSTSVSKQVASVDEQVASVDDV